MNFTEEIYSRLKNRLHDIIDVDDELSKYSVLFSSGDFLVSEEHIMHPSVRFMREVASRRGIGTLREYHVNLKIIRSLHSQHVMELSRVNNQPMEVMVSELITECVNNHASDLHIKIADYYADIYIRKDGDMLFLRQIESTEAHKLLATLYNNADDADATYKVNAYQAGRIVTSRSRLSIPDKVQSIRLQYNPLGNGGRLHVFYMLKRRALMNMHILSYKDLVFTHYRLAHLPD